MRVLVCGSRGWHDANPIHLALAECFGESIRSGEEFVVIHGAAKGADTLAGEVAHQLNATVIEEPAQWDKHGKGAGPKRNQKMLDDHNPDLVIAFRSTGKSRGTDDMVERAHRAGVTVVMVDEQMDDAYVIEPEGVVSEDELSAAIASIRATRR
jgi:SLOG family YspA-like protein